MKRTCVRFVFLFVLAFSVATSSDINKAAASCPTNSRCSIFGGSELTVDFLRGTHVDRELLSKQLDSLLSSNQTYGHLTRLSITNSPLTHVPRSVCRLTTLTQLHLDNNQLTRLPDNCLTNLTTLRSLSASRNNITELQDGLFDGLSKLQVLQLSHNQISSIGLRVFNGSAMLISLRYVDLSSNKLEVLEPWPYYIGINGPTLINLTFNNIRAFTNRMGWKARCGMKIAHWNLNIGYNPFTHLSDIFPFRGWNVSLTTLLCLTTQVDGLPSSYISFSSIVVYCDCVDVQFLPILRNFRFYATFLKLDGVYCNDSSLAPDRTYGFFYRAVLGVALDQFVCELTERCPSGCRCVHRPANATLHIYCSNTNLTVLPLELPELPKSYTKYKLDFSNNRLLRRLEHRDYFVNTSILDVSNSDIQLIENIRDWKDILKIPMVNLYGSKLTSLPQSVVLLNITTVWLNVAKNPWDCSCDNKWMAGWLKSIAERLTDRVLCYNPPRLRGENIIQTNEEQFCVDPAAAAAAEASKRAWTISMSSVAGVVVVLLSVVAIIYRLRDKLYTRWKFHPFIRDECPGEDMDYDVFFCCSSADDQPEGRRIINRLEASGYRVCHHVRDFKPGDPIMNNIEMAVMRSKRTVCLLTTNFIGRFASPIYPCFSALRCLTFSEPF